MEAVLGEAKDQWVDDGRVWGIVASLRTPPPEPSSDEGSDEEPRPDAEGGDEAPGPGEQPEPAPKPGDDRPPPAPPSSLSPRQQAQLSRFETAAKDLHGLSARSAREFLAASLSDFDLETTADFLQQVVREREKLRAAGGDQGGGDVAQTGKTG